MKLSALATVIRSKSAGPFLETLDIYFDKDESYARVRDSGILTKHTIANLYKMDPENVIGLFFVDAAKGIKISIPKPPNEASGDVRCRDLYGAQQYIPLLDIDIP
jgi:hypothetical protein